MSGLLMQPHKAAGQDGFRNASSKQPGGIMCRWVARSVLRLGPIDHTIILLMQARKFRFFV
jgi:hypothetical protein